jgi:hypothetical protein
MKYDAHHVAMQIQPSCEINGLSGKRAGIVVKVTYNAAHRISEVGHADNNVGVCNVL